MRNLRIFIAGLVAAGVTFGLFLFMFKLVSMGSDQRTELEAISGIHFGPVEIPDEIVERSRRKPQKPPPPKEPPPPPRMQVSKVEQTVQQMPDMDIPELDVPLSGGAVSLVVRLSTVTTGAVVSMVSSSVEPSLPVLPAASVAVTVTGVVPTGNVLPDAGSATTLPPPLTSRRGSIDAGSCVAQILPPPGRLIMLVPDCREISTRRLSCMPSSVVLSERGFSSP